jgi:hypothetical protein
LFERRRTLTYRGVSHDEATGTFSAFSAGKVWNAAALVARVTFWKERRRREPIPVVVHAWANTLDGVNRCCCVPRGNNPSGPVFRSDVQSLRKPTAFPLRCGNSFTDGSCTFIEFSSPSPPMSSPYCTFGTEDADLRSSNESCRRVHGRLDVRGSPCFQQDRVFEHYGAYRRTTSQSPKSDRDRTPPACAEGSSLYNRVQLTC